ncbi:MAG: aldehyde ferredoxin oxidoreductase C-terminal domain-containing protein, partial [Chloroflexota bacterium]|nr:aldehyde ferredoxin oxidoreductase C-terminal domain-containing protein [Chloroflexota bacterium]
GVCRFLMTDAQGIVAAANAATGWDLGLQEAMQVGRRIINLFRCFGFARGLRPEDERPSLRYGSTPTDGFAQGKSIMERWPQMQQEYYRLMGWDEKTGKPLPETLKELDLEEWIAGL